MIEAKQDSSIFGVCLALGSGGTLFFFQIPSVLHPQKNKPLRVYFFVALNSNLSSKKMQIVVLRKNYRYIY